MFISCVCVCVFGESQTTCTLNSIRFICRGNKSESGQLFQLYRNFFLMTNKGIQKECFHSTFHDVCSLLFTKIAFIGFNFMPLHLPLHGPCSYIFIAKSELRLNDGRKKLFFFVRCSLLNFQCSLSLFMSRIHFIELYRTEKDYILLITLGILRRINLFIFTF